MRTTCSDEKRRKREQMEQVYQSLRALALQYRVPVLLAQQPRPLYRNPDPPRPGVDLLVVDYPDLLR